VGLGGFFIIPGLFKPVQAWKLKKNALAYSKNSQISHAVRLGHYKEFSKLCQHPILNRIRVKNPGTNPPFEYLRNF
jgi:hypothetical protein